MGWPFFCKWMLDKESYFVVIATKFNDVLISIYSMKNQLISLGT